MGAFETLILNMQRMEFFQFLFPFLLALAIVYGLLNFALKEQLGKPATALISLIVAFFVMLYSSWNSSVVEFFANISGYWLALGSGIIFIVMLLALFGFKPKELFGAEGKFKWIAVVVVIFLGILIFLAAGAGSVIGVPDFATNSDFLTIIFFVVVLVLVVMWMGTGGEKSEGTGTKPTG